MCVGLADQPLVGPAAYGRRLACRDDGAQFAVATYGGKRGNSGAARPLVVDRRRRLRGDVGARALMGDHEVVEVDCTGTGDPRDVDTLEDLRALEEELVNHDRAA